MVRVRRSNSESDGNNSLGPRDEVVRLIQEIRRLLALSYVGRQHPWTKSQRGALYPGPSFQPKRLTGGWVKSFFSFVRSRSFLPVTVARDRTLSGSRKRVNYTIELVLRERDHSGGTLFSKLVNHCWVYGGDNNPSSSPGGLSGVEQHLCLRSFQR